MSSRSGFLVVSLVAVVAGAFLLGRATAGEEPAADDGPRTVKRYKIFLTGSVLEWSHGGGFWTEEVHLPEKGISVNVTWDSDTEKMLAGEEGWVRPKATAFAGKARNRFVVHPHDPETVSKLEDVEISAALAERIVAFEKLSRRQIEESFRLGKELVDAGVIRVVDDYTRKLLDLEKGKVEDGAEPADGSGR